MKIESIELKNFRNYAALKLNLSSRLVFITGDNGAGKTNILEAISILSYGKSFRGIQDIDLIKKGQDYFHISLEFISDKTHRLEYGYSNANNAPRRRIKANGMAIGSRTELIGKIPVVIFAPADLSIIEGGPTRRRKFLDATISFSDRSYFKSLLDYNRALKQRNFLLRKIKGARSGLSLLDPWDLLLIKHGKAITEARQKFFSEYNAFFQSALHDISTNKDEVYLQYEAEENLGAALQQNKQKDVQAGHTMCGPHRHNFKFIYKEQDILSAGSQGQKRSCVLALRFSQYRYLKKNSMYPPVLLIDDVLNELDPGRRAAFIELIRSSDQAILTNPDAESFSQLILEFQENCTIYRIEENQAKILQGQHG